MLTYEGKEILINSILQNVHIHILFAFVSPACV